MATPVQRKAARTVWVGVVVFGIILVALYITFQAQTGLPFAPTTLVRAEVNDIHSLRTNDDVRANSKRIGRVSDLEYGPNGTAIVTMELQGRYEVYDDARADIWDYSALATKFVELFPGDPAAGPLTDGIIPASRTEDSNDLKEVLDILDEPTRAAGMSTVREVGGGFAGRSEDLQSFLRSAPNLLPDLGETARALSDPRTDLRGLLDRARDLSTTLVDRERQLTALAAQTDTTLRALNTEEGEALRATFDEAPATLSRVRVALDGLNGPLASTRSAMVALEPGAAALGEATPDVRGVLREGVPVAERIPGVADDAVPALEELTAASSDARPLAPRAVEALDHAALALRGLAPYAPEIGNWAVRAQSFVSEGPNPDSRFARVGVSANATSVTGGLVPSSEPTSTENSVPGQAENQRRDSGLPEGLPGGLPVIQGGR